MDIGIFIIALIVVIGFAVVIYLFQKQIGSVNNFLNEKLNQSHTMMHGELQQSRQIISNITERLTKIDESSRSFETYAKQLQDLQNILKNPKQRGVLGEHFLHSVLENVLPPDNFKLQYKFSDGTIVDAVIVAKDGIIPIDAKFSLENYNKIINEKNEGRKAELEKLFRQDLKNRIDETSKYIKPKEKTTDFAFMFIPSEAIYYDLLINQVGATMVNARDLIEYAFKEKKVIIVSPTTFLAYLQTVLFGLRALKIEESAKVIQKNVDQLRRHLESYGSYFGKLGNNLGTTVNMYNQAHKEFTKIDKDILKITGSSNNISPQEIEKPKTD